MAAPDDKDERIRLLEFQVASLHRELTFITRRYQDMLYSAAWTLARPVKWIEDAVHRLVRSRRASAVMPASVPASRSALEPGASLEEQIAARIAAKMERPPAAR